MQWRVTQAETGLSLQNFLSEKLGKAFSGRQLKRAIEKNACTVNGRIERFASKRVGTGDVISFDEKTIEDFTPSKFDPERILYEDASLLVYNKPAGVASTPEELLKLLQNYHSSLFLVHRLDRDTTGCVILAKNCEVLTRLENAFRERQVMKNYLAVVDGLVGKGGIIDNYLAKVHVYQGQALWGAVASGGLHAITRWKPISRGLKSSLILCQPETGRTHQIRVHCSGMGHPILGDVQYGKRFQSTYHPQRPLLHADSVLMPHPITQQVLEVKAPLPDDFQIAFKNLHLTLNNPPKKS